MDFRIVAHLVGMVLRIQSVLILPAMAFCMATGEQKSTRAFFITLVIAIVGFMLLGLMRYDAKRRMYIKDGFVAVAICWIVISITGALPFYLSGTIPSFLDAFFESVSGFTTTGASIIADVEALPRGMLLWRSFTHWIGGMGVLIFLLAVFPAISGGDNSISVMKAESPGPSPGKLVPKLRQSAKILYTIYISLTILQMLFLRLGGMPVFDCVVNALATAGTGGVTITNASIAAYGSVYVDMVISVFMILFSINFNLFYFMLVRNFSAILKNEELRVYLGVIASATVLIAVNLTGTVYHSVPQALLYAFFQVSSVASSTGFSTADFGQWPTFSRILLFLLMFMGACAGSTGCGIKVSRFIIFFKEAKRSLYRVVHPRSVELVKIDGKALDKTTVQAVNTYLVTFILLFGTSVLLVSIDGFSFETTVTSVAACINNLGPGYGMVGITGNYSAFSAFSKIVLSVNMLLGRLEIYPILLLFSPRTWKRI